MRHQFSNKTDKYVQWFPIQTNLLRAARYHNDASSGLLKGWCLAQVGHVHTCVQSCSSFSLEFMPSAGPPPFPECPFGKVRASLSSGLVEMWRRREGTACEWGRDGAAWWKFCQKCHLLTWPLDESRRHGTSKPAFGPTGLEGDPCGALLLGPAP